MVFHGIRLLKRALILYFLGFAIAVADPATKPAERATQLDHPTLPWPMDQYTKKARMRFGTVHTHISSFRLQVQFFGPQNKDDPQPNLLLACRLADEDYRAASPTQLVEHLAIDATQATVDFLLESGFLDRATEGFSKMAPAPKGYRVIASVRLRTGSEVGWHEDLISDEAMIQFLKGLRKGLEGESARAIDKLQTRIDENREMGRRKGERESRGVKEAEQK